MNSRKAIQIAMDLRTAVNYAEVQILNRVGAFFVDTEFGVVCIETNAFKKSNATRPVIVLPWAEAPSTTFASDRCEENAEFWASIDIYGSQVTDHLSIIEVFVRAMFMSLGFENVDEAVVDAAVYLFVASYDSYSININMIEREFRRNHIDSLHIRRSKKKVMQGIVRELFVRKIESATQVYRRSEKLLANYLKSSEAEIRFYDDFCKELFGIILYANNEVKEDAERSYRLLVAYNEDGAAENSMQLYKETVKK